MKLTVIVEGQGLDLEPLADILETVAVEKERLMSAWLDIPLEMIPPKVQAEIHDTEVLMMESVLIAVKMMGLTNKPHLPIIQYIRSKIEAFKIPIDALIGLTIDETKIELILEIN